MKRWGFWVRWCMAHGGPDFCRFCLVVNRAFHQFILRRNPTFIGFQPKDNDKV
jgi:hypothetical protein